MANGIEFTSRPGKAFVAALKDPLSNYASLATGIACTEVTSGRYRLATAQTGIVWVDAVDGATRAVGLADLDNPAANGYADAVDSLLTVNVDALAAAIADAGVTLDSDAIAAIALAVFRRLANGSAAIGQLAGPVEGEPIDAINSADFKYTASIETDAASTIVFSIRKCADDDTPQLEADSDDGLKILTGVSSPTAEDAVVTRVSGTLATVLVKAASFASIAPGTYISEIRELTSDNETISKLELPIVVRRSASRRIAS